MKREIYQLKKEITSIKDLLAAVVSNEYAIGREARAMLESGIYGDDDAAARRTINRVLTAALKAEFAGVPGFSASSISSALVAAGFKDRNRGAGGGGTEKTPEKKLAAYLTKFSVAEWQAALKEFGYKAVKA